MQKRIPTISNLWPSMPRNETEERSGNFKPASPLASGAGWAKAADALKMTSEKIDATAVARVWTKRHPRDATSASQVRIGKPPLIEKRYEDDYGFRSSTGLQFSTPSKQNAREHSRSSEHASTARLKQGC